ncbi:MAG: hypothetical protein RLZZ476_417, partial [Verrucomicrobiota bacterium]
TIALAGLVIGRTYQVQLWILDTRTPDLNTRVRTVKGDEASAFSTTGGGPNILTGVFTADAVNQTITIIGTSGGDGQPHGPQLNLMQLRELARPPITVSNADDSGAGSLRQAIADAALASGTDRITFTQALNNGSIVLSNEISIDNSVGGNLTIDATTLSGGLILDGGPGPNRIITVTRSIPNQGSLTLLGLTLRGGNGDGTLYSGLGGAICNSGSLELRECVVEDNFGASYGGGIYCDYGSTTTLRECDFTSNSSGVQGGAVFADLNSSVTTQNCSFTGNSTANAGGAILFNGHPVFPGQAVTIEQCTFSGNTTLQGGGAVFSMWTNLTVTECKFANNLSTEGAGGAIVSMYKPLTIIRSEFSGNSCTSSGGAIHLDMSLFSCVRSTFHGNLVTQPVDGIGGAITAGASPMALTHCTLSGNQAAVGGAIRHIGASSTITNCVLVGNFAGGSPGDISNYGESSTYPAHITLAGANIIQSFINSGHATISGPAALNVNALLGPLGEYGGPTQTMALLPGSPARDAATVSSSTVDQRGFPIIGAPDIGAYEAGNHGNYQAWIWEVLPMTATTSQRQGVHDFDSDGQSNLNEWLAVTDPTSAASRFAASLARSGTGVDISIPTASGRTYVLLQSDSLEGSTWSPSPDASAQVGNGTPHVFQVPLAGGQKFYRVQVTAP